MSKENYFNVFDFGDSKIRFSVFDFKFSEKYSETKLVSNENKSDMNWKFGWKLLVDKYF